MRSAAQMRMTPLSSQQMFSRSTDPFSNSYPEALQTVQTDQPDQTCPNLTKTAHYCHNSCPKADETCPNLGTIVRPSFTISRKTLEIMQNQRPEREISYRHKPNSRLSLPECERTRPSEIEQIQTGANTRPARHPDLRRFSDPSAPTSSRRRLYPPIDVRRRPCKSSRRGGSRWLDYWMARSP